MSDDKMSPKESAELIASVRTLVTELTRRRAGAPREEHLILRLRAALFGTSSASFFETTVARFLSRGPVGKAYNLFLDAILNHSVVNDRGAVLVVIEKSGAFLEFASPAVRNDKEVVLAAVGQDKRAAQFMAEHLAEDREFLLSLPWIPPLLGLPVKYRDDHEVVMRNGDLATASERLRDDDELVKALISRDSFVFASASERLRDDKELTIYAISRQPLWAVRSLIHSASERLRRDPQVIAAAERWERDREVYRRVF